MAVCGGLPQANCTASDGYWRVPWSPREQLPFMKCKRASWCLGTSQLLYPSVRRPAAAELRAESGELGPLLWSVEQLLAEVPAIGSQAVLVPGDHESCADGRGGVGCESCAQGRFETILGDCVECRPGRSALQFVGIGGLALCFVAGLLLLAHRSGAKYANEDIDKKNPKTGLMGVLRVVIGHVQVLSIASAIDA